MIDFVSPFGRPKDRLDANEKRDRKRKLHYVTLFSETEKTSQTSHTNLRPTSDFSHLIAWILGADEFHIEARLSGPFWKSHRAGAGFMTPGFGFGQDMSDDIGYPIKNSNAVSEMIDMMI